MNRLSLSFKGEKKKVSVSLLCNECSPCVGQARGEDWISWARAEAAVSTDVSGGNGIWFSDAALNALDSWAISLAPNNSVYHKLFLMVSRVKWLSLRPIKPLSSLKKKAWTKTQYRKIIKAETYRIIISKQNHQLSKTQTTHFLHSRSFSPTCCCWKIIVILCLSMPAWY